MGKVANKFCMCSLLVTLLFVYLSVGALADQRKLKFDLYNLKIENAVTGQPTNDKNWYMPAVTRFRMLDNLSSTPAGYCRVEIAKLPKGALSERQIDVTVPSGEVVSTTSFLVDPKQGYYLVPMTAEQLLDYSKLVVGLDYGTLNIPFRYQLSNGTGGRLTPGGTLGGYVGARTETPVPLVMLVGAGLAFVPTGGIDDEDIDNEPGLTLAGGIVFPLSSKFQVGVVAGTDLVNDYQYSGNLWLSFQIGYSFTN